MENSHSIEAQPQEDWQAEYLQELEDAFRELVVNLSRAGVPRELIGDLFWLIEYKAHYYHHQMHSEEMTRH